ncbi:MAG: replicative DNA helicase [Armatimonadota bacterium]|nr:replicative DNA helicase [bacterium]
MKRQASAIENIPPQNLEAEQSTLGSMMIERSALLKGLEILSAGDFYRPAHQEVFEALAALVNREEPSDLITTQEELRKRGKLEDVGGTEYLMALVDTVPTAANIEYYARIVAKKSLLRRLIAFGTSVVGSAQANEVEADEVLAEAVVGVLRLQEKDGNNLRGISEVLRNVCDQLQAYQSGQALQGPGFGIPALDKLMRGNLSGEFNIIAGWPSEGKSALATQLAYHAAKEKWRVLVFSNEMSAESLVERMIYQQSGIESERARDGVLDVEEWSKVFDTGSKLDSLPIVLEDLPSPITRLAAKVRRWMIDQPNTRRLIIIDYLQIQECDVRSAVGAREQVNVICRMLKNLARETNACVVLLSQLSRRKEDNERPTLGKLRESGAIEAEADKVVMIHNPDNQTGPQRLAELYLRKHRNGRTGMVNTVFLGHCGRFAETELKLTDQEPKRKKKGDVPPWWNEDD